MTSFEHQDSNMPVAFDSSVKWNVEILSQSKPVRIRVLLIATEEGFSKAKPYLCVFPHLPPPFPFSSSHIPYITCCLMLRA